MDPDQTRFRLFDSVATFFKNAAQAQPLMLVLDDLHWADKPSLLLEFLARQMAESHILVIGTYRDAELTREHPLSETLAQLYRSPVFQNTVLGGLESTDVGTFLQAASGNQASPELVDAIYSHTEGNPFFMSEVIRLLGEQGELESGSNKGATVTLGIPPGVLEVIGERLNRLSAECVQALTTASIIGREFSFRLLRNLEVEFNEEQMLEVIDEALINRLIQESADALERYQFCHALIQQTLGERLSASRRVRLHGRIAEALEELYGADTENHAGELAFHFAEAEPVLGLEKHVKYSLLAGEQALSSFAYEDAQAHFQSGLSAKQGQPDGR